MFRIKLVGAAALLVGASLLGAMIAGEANAGSNPCSNISSGNYNVYTVKFTCGIRRRGRRGVQDQYQHSQSANFGGELLHEGGTARQREPYWPELPKSTDS